jgi:hypothetical protein
MNTNPKIPGTSGELTLFTWGAVSAGVILAMWILNSSIAQSGISKKILGRA